ncbi:MAG: hypothetical protein J6Z43_05775 [Clostridiales bacterium]|nr:hypothetical protein [Clostridiales bacterium]
MNDMIFTILYWTYNISRALAVLSVLVLGILITAGKVRSVKVLGISSIITAIQSGVSFAATISAHFCSDQMISSLYTASSLIGSICTIGGFVCICLFLYRNYGARRVCIPIVIVTVLSNVLSIIALFILRSTGSSRALPYVISIVQTTIYLVGAAVVDIIIIMVLYRNRQREKVVPKFWVLKVIMLLWTVVSYALNTISYAVLISAADLRSVNELTGFAGFWNSNQDIIFAIFGILGAVLSVLVPAYVFAMVRKNTEPVNN